MTNIPWIARQELRLLRRDGGPIVQLLLPLGALPFITPIARILLESNGRTNVTGAELSVPGLLVAFSTWVAAMVALSFVVESNWKTWDRLKGSPVRGIEILLGKTTPYFCFGLVQAGLVLVTGMLFFGLDAWGRLWVIALLVTVLTFFMVALGLLLVALIRNQQAITITANALFLGFAGFGGVLATPDVLPTWARTIAPLVPTYWASRGFRSVILEGGGAGSLVAPVAVLGALGILLLGGAYWLFWRKLEVAYARAGRAQDSSLAVLSTPRDHRPDAALPPSRTRVLEDGAPIRAVASIDVDQPIETVFAFLADPLRNARFLPTEYFSDVVAFGGETPGLAFVFRLFGYSERCELSLSECDPPARLSFESCSDGPYHRVAFVLTSHDRGTTIEMTTETRRQVRRSIQRLASHALERACSAQLREMSRAIHDSQVPSDDASDPTDGEPMPAG